MLTGVDDVFSAFSWKCLARDSRETESMTVDARVGGEHVGYEEEKNSKGKYHRVNGLAQAVHVRPSRSYSSSRWKVHEAS